MKPGKVTTPVVLGQPWQRAYNGVPNWRREGITFEKGGIRYFTPFLDEDCYTSDDQSETQSQASEPTPPADIQEECQQQPVTTPPLPNNAPQHAKIKPQPLQGATTIWVPKRLRQAQKGHAQIWIPKQTTPPTTARKSSILKQPQAPPTKKNKTKGTKAPTKNKQDRTNPTRTQRKERAQQAHTQQRWVPKKILSAQGYYEGATHVWLPKPSHAMPTTINKAAPVTQSQANYKWVPRQNTTDPPPPQQTKKPVQVAKQAPKRATAQEKGKWIPKQPSSLQPHKPVNTAKVATQKPTLQEKGKWIPKTTKQPKVPAIAAKPSTSQETSTQPHEGQASRAQVTDKARQLAYLLMTLKQETLVKLWQQLTATKTTPGDAASTTQATGPHMLQYPPLAQH